MPNSLMPDYKGNKYTSFLKRCAVAILDLALFFLANIAICYLTQNGHVQETLYSPIIFSYTHLILTSVVVILVNFALGLYESVFQYVGADETIKCVISAFIQTIALFLIDRVLFVSILSTGGKLSWYSYILAYVFILVVLIAPRAAFKIYKNYIPAFLTGGKDYKRVMIVGMGNMGGFIIDTLNKDLFKDGKPVIAVDDDPSKIGSKAHGVKIAGDTSQIPDIALKYKIDEIIICIPSAPKARQKEVIDIALQTNADVKVSPSMEDMLEPGGRLKSKKVDINDLLSRKEVTLDKKVGKYLLGKTILVTGGGGSIGSELCRQVARYNPSTIVIFDIYENYAFELANALTKKYGEVIDIEVRIGSVRDIDRLRELFNEFKFDVVFHAAAHKHVPLMEDSPCEAVKNNVFGTYNVALVAKEFKVSKMVILSTDKAVNPTNVMGCTKRITELIVQYMNNNTSETKYCAVRFGNVLGSRGSVIPTFEKQIAAGGPVTVTDEEITRYFMTIPEAAQLVCQAGGLSDGGEVFVLDMGEPVKIVDLAKKMIRLSGFTLDDIKIEFTGLRPGEKLYEELAMESEMETRHKTSNEKIYVNIGEVIDNSDFETLIQSLQDINNDNVREKLMKIVPNYIPAEN